MMKSTFANNLAFGACAFTLPVITLAWLSVPAVMSAVTFAGAGLLVLGAGGITLNSMRNARATENMSHVLNRAEARRLERR